jgi:translation initiation factor 2B subunit (eIF-2B alpha/beta/delta family)
MERNKRIGETSTILPGWIKNRIEDIKFDNTSGALKLTKQAAELLIFLVNNYTTSSKSKFIKVIEQTTLELTMAQPTMAPIFNLANSILFDISTIDNEEKIKKIIRKNSQQYIIRLDKSIRLIGDLTANIIDNSFTIAVHSYSDTILKALITAKEMNKSFNVICSESRPINEGMDLARKLGKQNIKTTLVVDSAIFSFLSETDLILVGADALYTHGLVNKIGTFGLALAAEELGVDFYTLCSTEKIFPSNYQSKSEKQKDASEISKKVLTNVNIINYYFDLTPLNYLTGIITEHGIKSPYKIKKYIDSMKIHKTLIN